jgi:FkbM family methyltransferase
VTCLDYYGNKTPICLIDIGANVGKIYDLLSKKISLEQTYMFEANYQLYNYLIEKYVGKNDIKIYHNAIGVDNTILYFDESSMDYQIDNDCEVLNFGLSKITNTPTNKTVKSLPISQFLDNNNYLYNKSCFIKIDTENFDYKILSDLINVIDLFKQKPIIEFENNYFCDGHSISWAQNIIDQYTEKGYEKLIVTRNMGDGILQPVL